MSGPSVFDGHKSIPIDEHVGHTGSQAPVPPAPNGDGSIFVSLPSFRDGERCAKTIQQIFENAKNPEKVIVGLIEQNAPEDTFCLEAFCKQHGVTALQRQEIRADMTKVMAHTDIDKCPYYKQIRLLSVHNVAAKGPSEARSMTRKIVGNEEFCLQIDAHSSFTKDWDEVAKADWHKTGNEFAILSTAPANMKDQQDYESWTGSKRGQVPRQCQLKVLDTKIPDFVAPADGYATNLEKPLLSHSWSAAFSFAKCHLEETAPYDPFAPYIMNAEQFPRFARFWTRGYDVYTPTRNIVYHDYSKSKHDVEEWFKLRRDRIRQESLDRIKSVLGIDASVSSTALANLGIYGLGKRRSLQQLMDFVGIDRHRMTTNDKNAKCANLEWAPYDTSMSPMDNLYEDADHLDPQPEFPLRTQLTFYEQPVAQSGDPNNIGQDPVLVNRKVEASAPSSTNELPVLTIFVLWIFGMMVWCVTFVNHGGALDPPTRRKVLKKKRASSNGYKDV